MSMENTGKGVEDGREQEVHEMMRQSEMREEMERRHDKSCCSMRARWAVVGREVYSHAMLGHAGGGCWGCWATRGWVGCYKAKQGYRQARGKALHRLQHNKIPILNQTPPKAVGMIEECLNMSCFMAGRQCCRHRSCLHKDKRRGM